MPLPENPTGSGALRHSHPRPPETRDIPERFASKPLGPNNPYVLGAKVITSETVMGMMTTTTTCWLKNGPQEKQFNGIQSDLNTNVVS